MARLPIIRHIRYFWLKAEFLSWSRSHPIPGWHINARDWAYLDAVWRGEI